ncbi:asparaginase [Brevibacillus marinus]|uniref:asparaginase n=1 Tax=Brevibacillus marinus TaxID=2496837 RepID=UPI000F82A81A|nr:asparaginase [Brevibacillus marinus]
MEQVLVIQTGGTIAMSADETEGVKPVDDQALNRCLPQLNRYAQVTMEHFANLPSPHMTLHVMNDLRRRIMQELEANRYAGIVVTHGTDTLEETAYFLDLTLPLSVQVPVVVTGAMRSSNEPGSDGPVNLISAVRTAIEPASRDKGVLVVFNEEIHAARHVTKTHTSNVAAFQSPHCGPIGTVSKRGVLYHHAPLVREYFPIEHVAANVPLIKAVAGMDPLWLSFLLEQPVDGLVIEGFGLGNLPPAIVPTLAQLLAKGVPIVLVSRCLGGQVAPVYDYAGGGRQLRDMGLIFSNGLNGPKARIKLIAALQQTNSRTQLQQFFER